MDQMCDDLVMYEYVLRNAQNKYHEYVKKRGWSDEDCYAVDQIKEVIMDCEEQIEEIQMLLSYP